MITSIIRWSILNRFYVLFAALFLTIFGIYSLKETPVDAIPDLSDIQVIIRTPFSGQTPQVVEDQVTYPLTTAMLAVPGSVTVRGYSFFGESYVYVIFDEGVDLYWARSRVLEYLNQVRSKLPSGIQPELGPDATGVGWIYEYALTDTSEKQDLSQLRSLQDWFLKYELQTVPGVSEVASVGGMVRQYQITLDPNRLRHFGIPFSKVKRAIQQSNSDVGGASIEMGEAEYMVSSKGYLKSLDDFNNISLGVDQNGIPIRLSELATINTGPQMRRGIAELNGLGEVAGGIVIMRQGENALKTIQAVKAKLAELEKSLPEGVTIVETYNRSSLIERAISTLKSKLFLEIIVVSFVCFMFLFHFRSSLVILISLPIGVLSAFLIMYLQGLNANIMSLGGIAIAVGVMVDAAIVMIENVHKHMENNLDSKKNHWKVIEEAAIEVGPALFFSLLIITLSFFPVFALQAQEGRMFSPLAFTKTYAMGASAILAITLVPVLMGYFIKRKGILPEHRNPVNRFLSALYKPLIHRVLKRPKTTLLLSFLLLLCSLFPLTQLGSEFMPELDEGDWMYMPTTLPGISTGKAQQLLQQMDKLIMTVPEVKSVFGKIGRAETATDPAPLSMIETVIQFKPHSEWRSGMTKEKLKVEFNELLNFPGVTNAWVMPIKTRIDMLSTGVKTPVGIKILGPDLNEIQKIGQNIEKVLKNVEGTASVYAERVVEGRYVNIDIDRANASRFGLNISDIQDIIRTAIGGMNITQTVEGLERYPVNLRYSQENRDSLESLKMLPIISPAGAHITLSDLANIQITMGAPMIKSENARIAGWVLVDIQDIDLGTYIKKAKQSIQNGVLLPPNYSLSWSGQYQYMERAKERLTLVLPIIIIIISFLLYIHFRNLIEVAIIMLTLPLSLTGGVWLLYLLDYNLSVAVGVGFIALAGLSVEIGVIMLSYLNQSLKETQRVKEEQGNPLSTKDLHDAVIAGSLLRIRPIAMTVSSTLVGLLSVMLGGGTGSEVMRRIAAPMVGGMISTILLVLIVIPAIYFLWKKPLHSK